MDEYRQKAKHNPPRVMFNAHRVEFSAIRPILAQMDGETVLLKSEDFPAAMVLSAPVIPVFKMSI